MFDTKIALYFQIFYFVNTIKRLGTYPLSTSNGHNIGKFTIIRENWLLIDTDNNTKNQNKLFHRK